MLRIDNDPIRHPINTRQLANELEALGLFNYNGVTISEEEPPYILVKFDQLDTAQEQSVRDVVAAHVADFTPSARDVKIKEARERLANDPTPTIEDLAVVHGYREPK